MELCQFPRPNILCCRYGLYHSPSYGSCTVSLGAVTQNDKLLYTSSTVNVKHIEPAVDEVGWPVPHTIEFDINGPAIDATDEQVLAAKDFYKSVLTGTLKDNLLVRVDVMAELPGFVKRLQLIFLEPNPTFTSSVTEK